jgi:ribosomal protein S18 acetylase RimI-like enzyme
MAHVRATGGRIEREPDFHRAASWVGEMRGDTPGEATALATRWQLNAAQVSTYFHYDDIGTRVARSVSIMEDGHLGIFDVGTLERHRGRGYACALLAHQLIDARASGAHTAYLQVTPDNPSRRIYERFGFRTVYQYWYRSLTPEHR